MGRILERFNNLILQERKCLTIESQAFYVLSFNNTYRHINFQHLKSKLIPTKQQNLFQMQTIFFSS